MKRKVSPLPMQPAEKHGCDSGKKENRSQFLGCTSTATEVTMAVPLSPNPGAEVNVVKFKEYKCSWEGENELQFEDCRSSSVRPEAALGSLDTKVQKCEIPEQEEDGKEQLLLGPSVSAEGLQREEEEDHLTPSGRSEPGETQQPPCTTAALVDEVEAPSPGTSENQNHPEDEDAQERESPRVLIEDLAFNLEPVEQFKKWRDIILYLRMSLKDVLTPDGPVSHQEQHAEWRRLAKSLTLQLSPEQHCNGDEEEETESPDSSIRDLLSRDDPVRQGQSHRDHTEWHKMAERLTLQLCPGPESTWNQEEVAWESVSAWYLEGGDSAANYLAHSVDESYSTFSTWRNFSAFPDPAWSPGFRVLLINQDEALEKSHGKRQENRQVSCLHKWPDSPLATTQKCSTFAC